MAKYHIGRDGLPHECHAQKGNCPLASDDKHFDNLESANIASQQVLEFESEMNGFGFENNSGPSIDDIQDGLRKTKEYITDLQENNLTDEELHTRGQELGNMYQELDEYIRKTAYIANGNDEWFDQTQLRKQLYFTGIAYQKEICKRENKEFSTEDKFGEEPEWMHASSDNKNSKKSSYNFHPDLNDKRSKDRYGNLRKSSYMNACDEISAYSGMTHDEINEKVNEYIAETNCDLTTACRHVYNISELRKDKNIVVLDLEVANAIRHGRVDSGKYSDIIEIGWRTVKPDGSFTEEDHLANVSDPVKNTIGTGAEKVHNISTEMVKDKQTFVENKELQEKVLNDLKGHVLLAHNANFEIGQLKQNLRGFAAAYNNGDIEIIDTMNISKYFTPETERNTNEAFVNAAGLEYKGQHRALADAIMSWDAMNVNKKKHQE